MALAGGILNQLDAVVSKSAKIKFSLLAGSYDTFMSFFGLTNLHAASGNFMGLPEYASTMAFELFTTGDDEPFPANPEDDLRVRFLFRNGTNEFEDLNVYPLWDETRSEDYSYGEFRSHLGESAITDVGEWCSVCNADNYICRMEAAQSSAEENELRSKAPGLSNAAAGGIGAAVTAVVSVAIGALAVVLLRCKSRRQAARAQSMEGKRDDSSASDSLSA